MILRDPSFERSHRGEHYALYFEMEMSRVMQIITIIGLKILCQLKSYLQTLNVNFSIVGVSENWGTVENIDVQTMPGHSHEYCIRSNGKRGGGVSIYVKSNLPYKVRKL